LAKLSQRDMQLLVGVLVVGYLVEELGNPTEASCSSESTVPPPAVSSIARSVAIISGS
jgi:hypothetical protein